MLGLPNGEWIETSEWVASIVMGYVAIQVAASKGVSLVTDERTSWSSLSGLHAPRRPRSRQMAAVTSLLPVSAVATAREIREFRDRHAGALERFRGYVERLVARAGRDDDVLLAGELAAATQERVELGRRLTEANLGNVALDLGLSALPVAAALAEHSPWSAGAGVLCACRPLWRHLARGRENARSPVLYAALAWQRFGRDVRR